MKPRRKRLRKHNFDPELCELPGSSDNDENRKHKISKNKPEKLTHYVCVPLKELIPQYDTIMDEIRDFYKNEEKPPKFSDATRDRLHLTLLMMKVRDKNEEEIVKNVLKNVCDNFFENLQKQQGEKNLMIEFDDLGSFHGGHLIYSGCSKVPEWLLKFRELIHDNLCENGILVENIKCRDYVPHVTILRHKQKSDDCYDGGVLLEHMDGFGLGNICVKSIDFLRIGGNERHNFELMKGVEDTDDTVNSFSSTFLRKYLRFAR